MLSLVFRNPPMDIELIAMVTESKRVTFWTNRTRVNSAVSMMYMVMNCLAAFPSLIERLPPPDPDISFLRRPRPPDTTIGMMNMNIMTMIIPPIQFVMALHRRMDLGVASTSVIIVAPVVLNPLTDSNSASIGDIP